jgi:predicted GNAT family N-acyltransferase
VNRLIDLARCRGLPEIVLHAHVQAVDFYRRLGFEAEGEAFMEAGIPHRCMRLRLAAGSPEGGPTHAR